MPITFQPASPAGSFPGLEMQAGAGQAAMQGLPTMQRAISDLIQSYAQRGAVQQRAQSDNAALQLRAQEYALGRQDDAARFNAQMQQQADMQGSAQQQQALLQDQHFQQQLQLMALEPTQRDQMRRVQLRGALADIGDAERSGALTPEQAADARAKTWGYLNPLQEQEAKWLAGQREAQAQARNEEAARARELWNMQQGDQLGFWHKTANQLAGVANPQPGGIRAIDVFDGDGNVVGHQVLSPEGKTHFVLKERGNVAEKLPPGVMNEQQFTGRVEAAMKMTDSDMEKGNATNWEETFVRNKARMGIPASGNYAEYLQSRTAPSPRSAAPSSDSPVAPAGLAQQAVDQAKGALFGGSPQLAQSLPTPAPAARPVVPPSEMEAKPYTHDKPVTPAQIQATATWKSLDDRLKSTLKPTDPEYRRLSNLIYSAANLHRQTGGYAKMNDKERERYNSDLQKINDGFKKLIAPKPSASSQYPTPEFGAVPF